MLYRLSNKLDFVVTRSTRMSDTRSTQILSTKTRHTEHCKFQIFEEQLEKKTMSAKKKSGGKKKI